MDKVDTLIQTCEACPAQWEGRFKDGREFYIRYRWGWLRVDVPFGHTVYEVKIGNDWNGTLSEHAMKLATNNVLDFSDAK